MRFLPVFEVVFLPNTEKWLKIAILRTGVGVGLFAIGVTSEK